MPVAGPYTLQRRWHTCPVGQEACGSPAAAPGLAAAMPWRQHEGLDLTVLSLLLQQLLALQAPAGLLVGLQPAAGAQSCPAAFLAHPAQPLSTGLLHLAHRSELHPGQGHDVLLECRTGAHTLGLDFVPALLAFSTLRPHVPDDVGLQPLLCLAGNMPGLCGRCGAGRNSPLSARESRRECELASETCTTCLKDLHVKACTYMYAYVYL